MARFLADPPPLGRRGQSGNPAPGDGVSARLREKGCTISDRNHSWSRA